MPDLVQLAIPGFILLLTVEVIFDAISKRHLYETEDAVSSLLMGIGNVISGLVSKLIVYAAYLGVYQFHLFELGPDTWWAWALLFFAEDFSYYWFHRTSHSMRFFWASHVVHHSSKHYNLSTALRQTWTGNFTGSFIFWLWLPLLGFHPAMILTMQAISLIYQFWIHTEVIGKFPAPIEWFFNTPSHHRVHHGSDIKYLDKNHAGVLIIWDRLFGTFQLEEERPHYGLTKNIDSYNPFRIAFHEWADIITDLRQPGLTLKERLRYLAGPPGYSHNGERKTTRQLREEMARLATSKGLQAEPIQNRV